MPAARRRFDRASQNEITATMHSPTIMATTKFKAALTMWVIPSLFRRDVDVLEDHPGARQGLSLVKNFPRWRIPAAVRSG